MKKFKHPALAETSKSAQFAHERRQCAICVFCGVQERSNGHLSDVWKRVRPAGEVAVEQAAMAQYPPAAIEEQQFVHYGGVPMVGVHPEEYCDTHYTAGSTQLGCRPFSDSWEAAFSNAWASGGHDAACAVLRDAHACRPCCVRASRAYEASLVILEEQESQAGSSQPDEASQGMSTPVATRPLPPGDPNFSSPRVTVAYNTRLAAERARGRVSALKQALRNEREEAERLRCDLAAAWKSGELETLRADETSAQLAEAIKSMAQLKARLVTVSP